MAQIGAMATEKVVGVFTAPSGLAAAIEQAAASASMSLPAFVTNHVIAQNVSPEIEERSLGTTYPLIHVYCSRLSNLLTEKFRSFSGRAEMIAEVRVSQDRLEGLESLVHLYVGSVTQVLDQTRGDWGGGVFFNGAYEISYGPVKSGGRNFLQVSKITFLLDVST